MSTTDDIAKRNCTEKTCLETVVSTTDEGAQPQAPVAFTEPTTVQYLPKEATQPLGKRNEHSARAAARIVEAGVLALVWTLSCFLFSHISFLPLCVSSLSYFV